MVTNSIKSTKQKVMGIVLTAVTVVIAMIYLFPFAIAILTAMKSQEQISASVFALPSPIEWENFRTALKVSKFGKAMINSLILTSISVFCITLFSTMGGYVIARNFKKKSFRLIESLYLAALMVPAQVIMVPIYKLCKTFGLLNTLQGMIIIAIGSSIPYATFLIIGFAKAVPKELEEAAMVDGCSPLRAFFSVVIPMLKPIIAVVASLHMLWIWNEFSMSIIILQKDAVRTIPIQQRFFFGQYTANYSLGFAAAIISMIPVIIFFLFIQKYIVEGISAGAIKG